MDTTTITTPVQTVDAYRTCQTRRIVFGLPLILESMERANTRMQEESVKLCMD